MIIPDVNLLVFTYNSDAPSHDDAFRWWEGLLGGNEMVGLPWVVVAGFVRLITSQSSMVQPATPTQALDTVDEWFTHPHVTPINPGARHLALFRRALEAAGVGGNLVTDAHIAALALEYQAEVHSNDNDFGRFSGLRWHNPLTQTR